ncbi:hypothetical protein PNEG_01064 [Pneumocystis murina B123]|uniref:Coenzyme Q-binding protein COQ10 START domain-containing protein n=1 Tax=Pneumocystis murina (strain B123) TaxID=1069680 RepID=M7NQC3_PNEMU|nr:hypothetical protein PNEG_01064 [Pneumocystis murina B123]EMR10918.1 hypothetical protein PNEG_01064 [Pneumocystis murina B123]
MFTWVLHPNHLLFQKKISLTKSFNLFIRNQDFLNSILNKSKRFSTYRILPYKKSLIFSVISDIDSYSAFLPYCLASKVTKRDKNGLPQTADLRIGWKSYDEIFSSKISYISHDYIIANASNHQLFQKLQATWSLKDIQTTEKLEKKTKISLILDFRFSNPLYTIISMAAMPRISSLIITAFENRIKQIEKIN